MSVSYTLQSTGVTLPEDLDGDDTLLICMNKGRWIREVPPLQPSRRVSEYGFSSFQYWTGLVKLALEYYNGKHQTEYKALTPHLCDHPTRYSFSLQDGDSIHTSFEAAAGDSIPRYFCTKISTDRNDDQRLDVASCEIADGVRLIGCNECDKWAESYPPTDCASIGPPLADYCHILADGVTLSNKAKHRLKYVLPALKDYNQKNCTDYKLVDVLPQSFARIIETQVGHINFIAKLNGGSKNELFFAEIKSSYSCGSLNVTDCRILSDKTKAGCHFCSLEMGKRVIHPTGKQLRSSSSSSS